ncbi:MAG: hypothetical protein ACYTX0_49240 [Nostoc sp.]
MAQPDALYQTLLYGTLRVACFHEVVRQAQGNALRVAWEGYAYAHLGTSKNINYYYLWGGRHESLWLLGGRDAHPTINSWIFFYLSVPYKTPKAENS